MKTLLCLLLDESGSMGGNEDAVVEGFNALLEDQLNNKGETNFYFLKFNHNVTTIYNNVPLSKVPKITRKLYRPYGRTALFDAISEGIKIMEKNVESVDRVIMVIFTDGKENGSRYANEAKCKEFFAKFQSTGNWSFLYIGEDSKEFSEKMDIPLGNTIDFRHGDIKANFEAASHACSTLRATEELQADNLLENFSRSEKDIEPVKEDILAKKAQKEVEAEPIIEEEKESVDVMPQQEPKPDHKPEPIDDDPVSDTLTFAKETALQCRKFAKKNLINLLLLLLILFTFYYFFPYFIAVIIAVLAMDYYDIPFDNFRLEAKPKK